MRWIPIVLTVALLGGCTQLPGKNLQGYGGITDVRLDWTEVDGKPVLSGARWTDGKEKQNVTLTADIAKGRVSYTATDVKAFPAIAVRGEVEKVLAEKQVEGARELLPALMDGILKAVGVP